MSKSYDIVARLAEKNVRPSIKVTDNLTLTVNTSKTTALLLFALGEDKEIEESERIEKMFKATIGDDQYEKVQALDLSFPAETYLIQTITASITGEEIEEVDKRFQKSEEKEI